MKAYSEYKSSGIDWLGEIPSHWDCVKIGYIFDAKAGGDAKPENYSEEKDNEHPYPVYTNTLIENQIYAFSNIAPFKSGSITVTGRGDIGHAFFRSEDFDAIIRLVVLSPKKNLYGKYFTYFIDKVIPFFTDSAAVGQLSAAQIVNYKILMPPIEEQEVIAAYLDDVTGKVDALMSEKKKQVEDLRAYRTSLITETVTRGLNPNAPLRPSGIDWLGEIPCHWQLLPLKYVVDNLDNLRQPISSENRERNNPLYDYYGASGVIDKIDYYNVDDTVLLIGEDGANLIMRNLPLIYKASGKIWVNNHAHILKPKKGNDYSFLAYILEAGDYTPFITGSAQPKLSQENLNRFKICIPPLSEQQAIAEFLDEKTAKIDALIDELTKQLDELAEYKKAVISEAVTGKVDVRDWKPNN